MLKKVKFLAKEALLRASYIMNTDCIFCKIAKKEVKVKVLYESELVVAFADVNPISEVHILIVPKRHIDSVSTIGLSDSKEIIEMFSVANKLAQEKKLDAFRLAFNAGRYQHVSHLHMHLLAGRRIEWAKL